MTVAAATLQGEFKFDSTERGGFMPKPIDPEWGLCDHNPLLLLADYRDDDEDYGEEWEEDADLDDDEPLGARASWCGPPPQGGVTHPI
jgi:hypothetical protein